MGKLADDEEDEQDRNIEMMAMPSDAVLHRYIRDLVQVRIDLEVGENGSKGKAVVQLEPQVESEQGATPS